MLRHLGNLSLIDWAIMIVAVVSLRLVSLSTRRYVKGVTDFLSANRLAGRYLLTIAGEMGNFGVVTFIAQFQVLWACGLSPQWWLNFSLLTGMIIVLTGWVYYRFRETRALTMAQFLEMRYSRRLRITAGIICWISGVVNFGIFPAVAARFFIYFCGIPDTIHLWGMAFPTIALVMLVDLGLALSFVNMGGQISVMITECVQGMFCCFAFIAVCATVLIKIHWGQMVTALEMAPANQSMLNPFHTGGVHNYNIWYYLIGFFGAFYSYMSWQGGQGFFSSARTPHEQKMGNVIGIWRGIPKALMVTLLGLATIAIMRLPEFANTAHAAAQQLSRIPNEYIQGEMRVPIAMANFLPIAVKGLLGTIFLFFSFTCHDTYMHSWGSIFVQDVYMPIKNKVLSPEEHIKLLRWSITSIAAIAFVWSLLYQPTEDILFFFAITGTIWAGGSGALIVGGLYWKKGNTAAAYTALINGATLGVTGLTVSKIYKAVLRHDFPINNQWILFIAMVSSAILYVIVSLATHRKYGNYNLDRMLHRGEYLLESDHEHEHDKVKMTGWTALAGVTKEFSRPDKLLAMALVTWNGLWFLWFVGFNIANLFFPIGDRAWAMYHFVHTLVIPAALCVPTAIWFTVGGVMDIRALFRRLATAVRDPTDDGRVEHVPEAVIPEAVPEAGTEEAPV